jgi:hypothetical protein
MDEPSHAMRQRAFELTRHPRHLLSTSAATEPSAPIHFGMTAGPNQQLDRPSVDGPLPAMRPNQRPAAVDVVVVVRLQPPGPPVPVMTCQLLTLPYGRDARRAKTSVDSPRPRVPAEPTAIQNTGFDDADRHRHAHVRSECRRRRFSASAGELVQHRQWTPMTGLSSAVREER